MATYKEVQDKVKALHGFVPKTCWIAHVLADHGKTKRIAPNRIDPEHRKQPCPPDKRAKIESVRRSFGMI